MRSRWMIALVSVLALGVWVMANASEVTIEKVPPPVMNTMNGEKLYTAYCGACHGDLGRGDGVASPHLGVTVPDLTTLAQRQGELKPLWIVDQVGGRYRSEQDVMPCWTPMLESVYGRGGRERAVLYSIAEHIQTLQQPVATPSPG